MWHRCAMAVLVTALAACARVGPAGESPGAVHGSGESDPRRIVHVQVVPGSAMLLSALYGPVSQPEHYRAPALKGNASAQNELGLGYLYGIGVPHQDMAEAVRWFRRAALQGHAEAQGNLGLSHFFGLGVAARDETEAVRWFRKAAQQGEARARFGLGLCFLHGRGVPKSPLEAIRQLRMAAGQGYGPARMVLQEFDKFPVQDDAEVQVALGEIFLKGQGVPRNPALAARWLRKAADQKNARGEYLLAAMYARGVGVAQDEDAALAWYRKAAEHGDARAQLELGLRYLSGRGVPRAVNEAMRWLGMAATQGEPQASQLMEKVYSKLFALMMSSALKAAAEKGAVLHAGGTGAVKRYMEAAQRNDTAAAAAQLLPPAGLSPAEEAQRRKALEEKIRALHGMLGGIMNPDTKAVPTGPQRSYSVSMIPPRDQPAMAGSLIFPVTFGRAGKGALAFMTGDVNGRQGLYEVQYWCFTCAAASQD